MSPHPQPFSNLDAEEAPRFGRKQRQTPPAPQTITERVDLLGIPPQERTPAVMLAVSALLEKLDDVHHDLARTRENLAELQHLVDVDCVAPIPNRRAFVRRLSWAISMHERYRHPSAVIYFDLNDFKAINDHYGHAAGDAAIRHVSQILGQHLRESDFLARIGGDEFAIIMYYADQKAADVRATALAERIATSPFIASGHRVHITTAYGSSTVQDGDTAEDVLSRADVSMYLHKKRVRDNSKRA